MKFILQLLLIFVVLLSSCKNESARTLKDNVNLQDNDIFCYFNDYISKKPSVPLSYLPIMVKDQYKDLNHHVIYTDEPERFGAVLYTYVIDSLYSFLTIENNVERRIVLRENYFLKDGIYRTKHYIISNDDFVRCQITHKQISSNAFFIIDVIEIGDASFNSELRNLDEVVLKMKYQLDLKQTNDDIESLNYIIRNLQKTG